MSNDAKNSVSKAKEAGSRQINTFIAEHIGEAALIYDTIKKNNHSLFCQKNTAAKSKAKNRFQVLLLIVACI